MKAFSEMKAFSYEELLENESKYMFTVDSLDGPLSVPYIEDCYSELSDAIESYQDYYASDDYFVVPETLVIYVFERRNLYDLLDSQAYFDEILDFTGSYQEECDPYYASEEVEALGDSFIKMFDEWKEPLRSKFFCGKLLGYLDLETVK